MTSATFGIVASDVGSKKNKPKGVKGTRLTSVDSDEPVQPPK